MGSYRPEVLVQGSWSGNELRFATAKEAEDWAQLLTYRWTLCSGPYRATETPEEPTHRLDPTTGRAERLEADK